MKMEDMIIASIDDHVSEPPNMFDNHLPEVWKSKAPKLVKKKDGSDWWTYGDFVLPNVGLNAVVGRPKEEYGMEPQNYEEIRKANYDIHARIDDMNANGVLSSLCFGTVCGFAGDMFSNNGDRKTSLRMIQAYNDWHVDEWAGTYPGRIIPMTIIPYWDMKLAVEEIERNVKKDVHAITFTDNPYKRGFPPIHDEYWEPLWKVCNDNKVVINCHIGTGSEPPVPSPLTPQNGWIVAMPISISTGAADWLHLEALQRYPDLKIALSEGSIGWVPYLLERADYVYTDHIWTGFDFKGKTPSEVFREHFITCFIKDKYGLKNYQEIGEDIITYECDYPHSDSTWPYSPEQLWENGVSELPDSVINKITHENVFREYSVDPISLLGRQNCTVGALRAQATHVDVTPKPTPGFNPAKGDRPVTCGNITDMMQQMAVAE